MKTLLLIAILIGCNKEEPDQFQSNPTFTPIIEEIRADMAYYTAQNLRHIPIAFGETDIKRHGSFNGYEISINKNTWGEMSVTSKYLVVLHEVGHLLGKEHNNRFKKYLPVSIMNENLIPDWYFMENKDELLREFWEY